MNKSKTIASNDDLWWILRQIAEQPDLQPIAEASIALFGSTKRQEHQLREFTHALVNVLGTAFSDDNLDPDQVDRANFLGLLTCELLTGIEPRQRVALHRFVEWQKKQKAIRDARNALHTALTRPNFDAANGGAA